MSCGGEEPAAPQVGVPVGQADCSAYADVPNGFGYCIYSRIRGEVDPVRVVETCGRAGDWEGECRHSWVSWNLAPERGVNADDLLTVCGPGADCALEVLDVRADPDLATQFARCKRFTGRFADDCAGHALERWWVEEPPVEEIGRVAALDTPFPERVAFFISASAICRGIGTCDGEPTMQVFCEKSAETFRKDRMRCPGKARPVPLGGAPPQPRGIE